MQTPKLLANKPNKAGDANVKAHEITPRLGVWGDKGCGRSADPGFHWGLIRHSRSESCVNYFVNSFGTILRRLGINSTSQPQPFTGSSGYWYTGKTLLFIVLFFAGADPQGQSSLPQRRAGRGGGRGMRWHRVASSGVLPAGRGSASVSLGMSLLAGVEPARTWGSHWARGQGSFVGAAVPGTRLGMAWECPGLMGPRAPG